MIEMGGQHQGGVKGGGPGSEPGHSPGGGVSPSGGCPHPSRSPVAATPGNNPTYPDNLNASPHSSSGPSPIPPTVEHRDAHSLHNPGSLHHPGSSGVRDANPTDLVADSVQAGRHNLGECSNLRGRTQVLAPDFP